MIFVSYRRADSGYAAGRLCDRLRDAFGAENVFKDVDDIRPGERFEDVLRAALAKARVTLALIGPTWSTARGDDGERRLFAPKDYVRMELEAALALQHLLIPVVLSGGEPPAEDDLPASLRPLAGLQSAFVRTDPDFHRDVDRLFAHVARVVPRVAARAGGAAPSGALVEARTELEELVADVSKLAHTMNQGNVLILGATEVSDYIRESLGSSYTAEGFADWLEAESSLVDSAVVKGWFRSSLWMKLDELLDSVKRRGGECRGGLRLVGTCVDLLVAVIRDAYSPETFRRILTLPKDVWRRQLANAREAELQRIVNDNLVGNAAAYYVARYEEAVPAIAALVQAFGSAVDTLSDSDLQRVLALPTAAAEAEPTRTASLRRFAADAREILGDEVSGTLAAGIDDVERLLSKEHAAERLRALPLRGGGRD